MKSIDLSWMDCSESLFTGGLSVNDKNVAPLYDSLDKANEAMNTVASAGDIGTLSIPLTFNDIEELNEKRRKLVYFCNAIHYEVNQMIDNPFSVKIADIIEAAYALDPADFEVKTGKTLWWDNMTSLSDLIASTITDETLKADFKQKAKALNKDEISGTLKDAITEARFWEEEYRISDECQRLAEEVFTRQVRDNWDTMTEDERKAIIQDYVNRISNALFGENTTVKFDASGYGFSSPGFLGIGRQISINLDFVSNPEKNFSIDKVMDTLTHEMRHQYQSQVKGNLFNKYGVSDELKSQWNAPYISYDPKKNNYNAYYAQEVERDARAYAALSRPVW